MNLAKRVKIENILAAAILKSREEAETIMDKMIKEVKNRFKVK